MNSPVPGRIVWDRFQVEVVPTFTGTTKREWLDRWDQFIGEKIREGLYWDLIGVNPYWRGLVGKLATSK